MGLALPDERGALFAGGRGGERREKDGEGRGERRGRREAAVSRPKMGPFKDTKKRVARRRAIGPASQVLRAAT